MRIEVMQPTGHLDATSTNYFRQQTSNVLDRQPDVLLIDVTTPSPNSRTSIGWASQ